MHESDPHIYCISLLRFVSLSKKTSLPGKCAYKLTLCTVACFEGLIHLHVIAHRPTEAP